MLDQSNMNETNLQYRHKNQFFQKYIMVDLIKRLLKIYQYHISKETIIKALQNFVIQVWKTQISRMFCSKTGLIFV